MEVVESTMNARSQQPILRLAVGALVGAIAVCAAILLACGDTGRGQPAHPATGDDRHA
jgi:hypothetical protein